MLDSPLNSKLHVVNNLAVSLICVDQFDESFKIIQTALESESGKREIREEEIPQLCLLTVNGLLTKKLYYIIIVYYFSKVVMLIKLVLRG
jgi:hypothetical protein